MGRCLVAVAPRGGERALRLRSPFWFSGFTIFPVALTERTLALVPRAKYPHCSARARDGLASLPPLHSLTHLLHRFRRSLPLTPKSSNLTRPPMQTAGAPKLQTAKTSSLALLARLEPSLRFRFSLIALGRATEWLVWHALAARLRPARRDYGARRCLSPKAKALASRGFARCKTSAIAASPASFCSFR